MALHHLLPFLALIIFLIPLISSSHAQMVPTPALFSDPYQFLSGGENLTDGNVTLSLSNDCGLTLYDAAGSTVKYFNTKTNAQTCILSLNRRGQLVLRAGNEQVATQTIGDASAVGHYALLFLEGKLSIFGPAIWDNGVKAPYLTHKRLKEGTSNNFLVSPEYLVGNANGDVQVAQNGMFSASITSNCTLSVKDDANGGIVWESSPATDEPKDCMLLLLNNGELLLQYREGSELHTQWTGGYFQEGQNTFVTLLRYYGRISIYGFKIHLRDISPAPAPPAPAPAPAAANQNIKMVTA